MKRKSMIKRLQDMSVQAPYAALYIERIEAPSLAQYYRFSMGGRTTILTCGEVGCAPNELMNKLNARGILLFGKEGADALANKIPSASLCRQVVIEHSGREGKYFGLVNGRVLRPAGADNVDAVFPFQPDYHRKKNTTKGWRLGVGRALSGHPLLQYVSIIPLAAGLAEMLDERGPLVFEIICPPTTTRLDLSMAAASVAGSMVAGPIPFETFTADPSAMLNRFRGTLLILDEPGRALAAETSARSQRIVLETIKSWGNLTGANATLITGSKAIADWAGSDTETAKLLREQVITIVPDPANPFGLYQSAAEGGVAAQSSKLQAACRLSYGSPFRDFMQEIVQRFSDDEGGLRAQVERYVDAFTKWANLDPHDRNASREARVFGFVYAAGRLAQQSRILPSGWRLNRIVTRTFLSRQTVATTRRPLEQILDEIASSPTTLRLDTAIKPTAEKIAEHKAFVLRSRSSRKLFIRCKSISDYPELYARLGELKTKELLLSPDPVSSRQRLGVAGLARVYAFSAKDYSDPDDF